MIFNSTKNAIKEDPLECLLIKVEKVINDDILEHIKSIMSRGIVEINFKRPTITRVVS